MALCSAELLRAPDCLYNRLAWCCSGLCLPADDENDAVLFEKIKSGNYDADDPIWDHVSNSAKDLVVSQTCSSALRSKLPDDHRWESCKILTTKAA